MSKTPAPSRRFLPPGTSSLGKQSQSSGKAQGLSSGSQRKFVTPYASSVSTVRFTGFSGRGKEEIDTSFEDDEASSPAPTHRFYTPIATASVDLINDDGDGSPLLYREERDDEVRDPAYSRTRAEHADRDLGCNTIDFETPLKKRRKLSMSEVCDDVISTYSSPNLKAILAEDESDNDRGDHDGKETTVVRDENRITSNTATLALPKRFRMLNSGAAGIQRPQTGPTFRPFPQDGQGQVEADLALPDAFSPSRKKGKVDYVSGGLASTARSWILGIAGEESQRRSRHHTRIKVKEVCMDRSGRAVHVIASDEAEYVLAAEQGDGGVVASTAHRTRIIEKGELSLRGTSTTWQLPVAQGNGKHLPRFVSQWEV
jgi:hypothetical protein